MIPRIIPCLQLDGESLVKAVAFRDPAYVGDAVNAIKIYNDKEVDELIFLDIRASEQKKKPNMEIIREISDECFMPLCYGGGVNSVEDARTILAIGVEKIAINTAALDRHELISELANQFGSQSVVVSIDVKRNFWGKYEVCRDRARKSAGMSARNWAVLAEQAGAGEILLTSVEREGSWKGYDLKLIAEVASAVHIPVIACGGAGQLSDFRNAVDAGASACAAGSMFVYQKKGMGVLINFPQRASLFSLFGTGNNRK